MMPATVLVVDDDEPLRASIADVLEDEGYVVRHAANGAQALAELAASDAPSLILLDLRMPVMDGFEFRARQLQDARIARIPVIAFTADASVETSMDGADFALELKKPLRLEDLLRAVEACCRTVT
jgi:CheY-like chemotaxis protein